MKRLVLLSLTLTLLLMNSAFAVTVKIHPVNQQIQQSETGTVEVKIESVTNLGAFEFEILYDKDLLNIASPSDVVLGPFISSTGRTAVPTGPTIDNNTGKLTFGAFTFGGNAGPNGDGTLATITFTALNKDGTSTIDLQNVQVTDIDGNTQSLDVLDGQIQVGQQSTETTVKVDPALKQIADTGSVDIKIDNVTNLGAFEFKLKYNVNIVKVSQASDVTLGSFISSTGRTAVPTGPTIDNDKGELTFGAFTFGSNNGPDGSGVLATINFTAQNQGNTTLDLDGVQVTDINGDNISFQVSDGELQVEGNPLATLTISPDTDTLYVGEQGQFSVTGKDADGNPVLVTGEVWDVIGDIGTITDTGLFTATKSGTGKIKATVGSVSDETGDITVRDETDSMTVFVEPVAQTVDMGNEATINIEIKKASNLGAFEFTLLYDKDILQLTAGSVQLGEFLESTGRTAAPTGVNIQDDTNPAKLTYGAFSFGSVNGPSGSGVLATIKFQTLSKGTSDLPLTDVQVTDINGDVQAVELKNGSIIVNGGETMVKIVPAFSQIGLNDTATVDIKIENVNNLGAFEFVLHYDGNIVEVAETSNVILGDFPGSTGRTVVPTGPNIDNVKGELTFGAFSFGIASGPNGDGVLAEITLTAKNVGETTLELKNVQVTDTNGNLIPVTVLDGQLSVVSIKYGDVDGDGEITALDASKILQHIVGLISLSDSQLEAADVTGNGSVTALDAALVLQHTVGLITQFPVEKTPTAPILNDKAERQLLKAAISKLENTHLNYEQRRVFGQLKHLVEETSKSTRTTLLQNYPNPFNPETWIPFKLASDADVTITIYNIRSELIRTLNIGRKQAGTYVDKGRAGYWNGRNEFGERVASGVYFYMLQAGYFSAMRRMLIVK